MSEAKKSVVIDSYPADKLPAEWRGDFAADDEVRITIEKKSAQDAWDGFRERLQAYHQANPGKSVTSEEAVARVRVLRDEWD